MTPRIGTTPFKAVLLGCGQCNRFLGFWTVWKRFPTLNAGLGQIVGLVVVWLWDGQR